MRGISNNLSARVCSLSLICRIDCATSRRFYFPSLSSISANLLPAGGHELVLTMKAQHAVETREISDPKIPSLTGRWLLLVPPAATRDDGNSSGRTCAFGPSLALINDLLMDIKSILSVVSHQ